MILSSVLLLLGVFINARPLGAAENPILKINEDYRNANFEQALAGYLRLLETDPYNPSLLYNAGNCHSKLGHTGQAVAYYLRAFNLLPRNSDIRHNLEYVMKHSGQSFRPEGAPPVVYFVYYFFSYHELKAISIILFWILCLSGALYAVKPGLRETLKSYLAGISILFVFLYLWSAMRTTSPFHNSAVIIRPDVPMLSGPGENFKAYANLPEGSIVKVIDSNDLYYEIGVAKEGIKGWIKKEHVEKI